MIETQDDYKSTLIEREPSAAEVYDWFVEAVGDSSYQRPSLAACERHLPLLLEWARESPSNIYHLIRTIDCWTMLPWHDAGAVPNGAEPDGPRCHVVRLALAGFGVRHKGRVVSASTVANELRRHPGSRSFSSNSPAALRTNAARRQGGREKIVTI